MGSRDDIFRKLRAAPRSPLNDKPDEPYIRVVPLEDTSPAALLARFIEQAEKLNCTVGQYQTPDMAIAEIVDLLVGDEKVLCWDFSEIPLPGLDTALQNAGCQVVPPNDGGVRVGITGANAALAATGTLVLASGPGRHRLASLLPRLHIAVITADQILSDMETWMALQHEQGVDKFRQSSNIALVSGPSRTADIALELIMGMHGPESLHIVIMTG